ncbi:MAG: hypothetical protein K6A69_10055 [Lachnospiraceae bacterium]|nr:hypothetical protein [Lachnospiraceae bacterium]
MGMEIGTKVWNSHDPYSTQNVKQDQKKEGSDVKMSGEESVLNRFDKETGTISKKSTYEINKMSKEDRDAIVAEMQKAEREREQSLTDMVRKLIGGQTKAFNTANGGITFSGTVSQEAIRQAQKDISEDGYYGVKQTSQRLFDFASALAGDDVDKMKKMQSAMNKGIGQAAKALGGHLPSISKDTQEAANKLFDDYYKSKEVSDQ